jgi:hypothetical protein
LAFIQDNYIKKHQDIQYKIKYYLVKEEKDPKGEFGNQGGE